jgi:hypothetical protein
MAEKAFGEAQKEAPVRVELTMTDLQSVALATWRRRLKNQTARGSFDPFLSAGNAINDCIRPAAGKPK